MLGRKLVSNASVVTAVATLVAVAVVGGCDRPTTSPVTNQSTFAAHLVAQSGNSQSGPATLALPAPVTVMVTNIAGAGITGATVTFAVRSGGGSVSSNITTSNASGLASTTWTLGSALGAQRLVAILNNGLDSAVFTATATNGPAAQIVIVSGSGQVGRSGQILANPLVVEVHDATGAVLSGVPVAFTEAAGNSDAFVSSTPVTTGADGRASVSWTLGKNTGNSVVPMSVSASPVGVATAVVTFTATARPELRIRRDVTPFLQYDTTGSTLGSPSSYLAGVRDTLRVQVYDPSDSSGVQNVTVTWAGLSPNDGHPINATTVTDNKGFAKTLWALVTEAGNPIPPSNIARRMIATASMGQVEFQASVFPGRVCGINFDAVSGTTTVGSTVGVTGTVQDCNGFGISSASVSFAASNGGVAAPSPVTSSASGQIATTWTLGNFVGVQKLSATASAQAFPYVGAAYPAYSASNAVAATVTPVPPASIVATGAPASGHSVGPTVTITITVSDANGNPMPGQSVVFAVSQGSVASSSPQVTGAAGTVVLTWTLAAGTNTLTYNVGSLSGTPVTIIDP